MKVFHAREDFLPAITQGWLWLGPASPFRFIYFPLWQKIYPEDKSRHLHLQVNEMKPSKPEKSLPKRVFKHGRMQSNTPANGLAHDLFSKRYVLINRVLGHGGPQAGNYCRGFCVFCVCFVVFCLTQMQLVNHRGSFSPRGKIDEEAL